MPRRTALIVPVPQANAWYVGPPGVPAHVTVLYPFAQEDAIDAAALASLLAAFAPFSFVLDRIERFADGMPWLHPEPTAPLRTLIDAVWERWPEHPPYEGAIADPTPHVTVTHERAGLLPIACRATHVLLLAENEDGSFEPLRSFALQGVA